MKTLFSKIKNSFLYLSVGFGLIYLSSGIIPSLNTGTKIDEDKISITKRKGFFSTVSYETSKAINSIVIYNNNIFSKSYGLISLDDYDKDNIVDEVYFLPNHLTEHSLRIERPEKEDHINYQIFQEADKIYQEEIKKFK